MKTPYFLIHQELLQENIERFTQGMCANWNNSRFGYSVKTNSLPWLLSYVRLKGGLAEVVSDEEYDLALLCGFLPNEIIFNGPIKGKDKFYFALEHGSIVNIDSENEIRWIEEYGKPLSDLGIRINVPSEVFNSEDTVEPRNAVDLQKKMEQILNSDYKQIGYAAHEYVATHFDSVMLCKKILERKRMLLGN